MTRFGSYELISELGRGGMGVVYRARHAVLGTPAVVKLLLPEFTQNVEITERFVREAKAAAALQHPHIVEVKDCGQVPGGQWYIALEYLDGVPLSKWLDEPVRATDMPTARRGVHRRTEAGPVPPAQVVAILSQAANALHTAHEHESAIVHRDVKPDNIFLVDRAGNELFVVLLDFGIAKLAEERAPLTRTGVGMGTPAYMAPEQLLNAKDVDRRADVYALGVVMFQLLTGGHLPWGQDTAAVEIYRFQTSQPPPDARTIVPSISPALVEVMQRAMAPDRNYRWPDAAVFAQALAEAVPASGMTPSGPDILRTYAPELLRVPSGHTTVGNRISGSVAAAVGSSPPVAWHAPSAQGAVPTPIARPMPGGPLHGSAPRGDVWTPPPASPVTTLGASAAQSVPNTFSGPRGSRRGLYAALGAVGVAAAGVVAVVALTGGGEQSVSPSPAASSSALSADAAPAMTPVAVLTEPAGAAVFVDDQLQGTSPTTVSLPPGRVSRIRVELAGHAIAEEVHTVADRPETVRIQLIQPVDGGLALDAGVEVDAATVSRRPPGVRPKPGGTKPNHEASSGSSRASGSGSAKPFDPNSVGGE